MEWLEIQFWRVAKWLLKRGYGYCEERDPEGLCAGCKPSDFQDWIDHHIDLLYSQ